MTLNWKLSLLVILSGLGAGGGAELLLSSQAVMAQTNAVPVETNSSEESPDPDTSPILSVRDRLDETSNTLDDGSYYDAHTFEGEAGQTIVIEMISEEFDTYLILRDPEGKRIAENDDGDGTNARIEIELPATGTYTIWANSYETGEIGEYSLSVQEGTSLDLLQQALDDAQERGDRAAERDALNDIAGWYDDREQYLEAADYYLQGVDVALVLLDEAEGEEAIAEANDNVAFGYLMANYMYRQYSHVLAQQGRLEESIEVIEQAIELIQTSSPFARATNDPDEEARLYIAFAGANNGLSNIYFHLSQYENALAVSRRAIETLNQIPFNSLSLELQQQIPQIMWNSLGGLSTSLYWLGEQYREEGNYEQALELQDQNLAASEAALRLTQIQLESELPLDRRTIWEEMKQGSIVNLITNYSALASIYEDQFDYEKELEIHQIRLEIAQQQENVDVIMSVLTSLYSSYDDLSRYQETLDIGQQMLDLAYTANNQAMIIYANFYLGSTYGEIGRFPEAVNAYEEALGFAREENLLVIEQNILNNLGNVYQSQGEYRKAFEIYNSALEKAREFQEFLRSSRSIEEANAYCGILQSIQNTVSFLEEEDALSQRLTQELSEEMRQGCFNIVIRMEETALNNIASLYSNQGLYQKAIEFYEASLEVGKLLNVPGSDADTIGNIGTVYVSQGDYDAALVTFQEALTIFEIISDQSGIARMLSNIGSTYNMKGDYEQSIFYLEKALAITQDFNLLPQQTSILGEIGTVYYHQGNYGQAVRFLEQAMPLSRQMGLLEFEASQLGLLGNVASVQGQYEEAIDYAQRVLAMYEQMNDLPNRTASLVNLGRVYGLQGKYAEAIATQEEALNLIRSIEDRDNEAYILRTLGYTYFTIGRYEYSLRLNEEALAIYQDIGDRSSTASTLNAIGEIYLAQGEFEQAFQKFEQAFAIREDIGELAGQSSTLRNIGFAYEQQQDYTAAKDAFEESLSIQQDIGARGSEGITLNGLALAQLGLNDPDAAIESLQQALALHQELGDRPGQAKALSDLGKAYFQSNQLSEAETTLYEALELLETLRASELKDTDKVALFDTQLQAYETLQQVLIAQNNPIKTLAALEIAERGRARAFVESLTIRLTSQPQLDASVEAPNLANIRQIAQQQNATLVNYSIVRTNPDTLQLYIWVIQPTGEISFKSVDLSTLDRSFSELITLSRSVIGVRGRDNASIVVALSPEEQQRQQAEQKQTLEQLYDILIAPVVSKLPTDDTDRVIFIPQGDLFLVPFAALINENNQYLIEKHTISIAPSIQTLELTHQLGDSTTPFTTNPLIVGNPDMPQVWNPNLDVAEKLPYLEGAEKEAVAIAQLLNIEPLLQNNATETVVIEQMQTASLIHLATHGLLEYGTPEESGLRDLPGAIALAPDSVNDGLLTSAEIYDMQLNAELVVLSACDTGRGNITGDGVIGLSRSFMQAGVPSVVVSLWSIPDDSTEFLMTQFYRNLSEMDKAQALRQAMLTTMQNQEYFSPLDWAAFTLIGEAE